MNWVLKSLCLTLISLLAASSWAASLSSSLLWPVAGLYINPHMQRWLITNGQRL